MRFIGQYIQSFIARFRNDVYLEDIDTGTIASGGNLGLDSNNKIVKADEATGDITGVALTAGTGVDLTSVSGATGGAYAATIGVDVSDFMSSGAVTNVLTAAGADTMQAEPYFTFRNNSNNSTLALLSNEDTGDLFNIVTTTHGATTLSTVDDDATAAHFKIAADGDILLEPATGDLTMYNAVNDGNPTISLGSSATNRFEIKSLYNSGAQTLDQVQFNSYTTSSTNHDGRYVFNVDEVELAKIIDSGFFVTGDVHASDANTKLTATDTTTSSATQGGKIRLRSNDGAAMGDDHRLGVIEFHGAEDASSTISIGARIQAICRDAWDSSNNDADLEFYTTNGTTESKVLTLDADKLATFTGAATVTGLTTLSGNLTFDSVALTGIQTSGETFVDNDVSLMTSAAIDDKINTKYAYSYMTWSASAKPTRDGSNNPEWMLPNVNKGIYEEDWNADSGITSTTTGTTTYGFSRYHAANSLIIPHAGVLVGFHAIGRNDDSDLTFKAGLFHADNGSGSAGADGSAGEGVDYGNTSATNEYTLRCVATAVETEASGGTDGTTAHNFKGPCKLISNTADLAVQAGDALMPAIMGNSSNSTDEIFVTMTIILKIPLTT